MDEDSLPIKQHIDKLISIVIRAGERISDLYQQNVEVIEKSDGSPVTEADKESHNILAEGLSKLLPGTPVISEEDEDSWKVKSDLYWLIDPLDGTKGFIYKSGDFCINVALMKNDKPILGLIHIPLTKETFYAFDNKAWRYYEGKSLVLQTRAPPNQGLTLLLGGYGLKFQKQQDFFLKSYPVDKVKHMRSAIKFCYIANGLADLYIRVTPCSEWDTAAGQILVECAGGLMTKLDGSTFMYGKPKLINEGFVVFGKKP